MAKRKIDEQISYNWLFVALAGLFALVTAWAVYDEAVTRREWKGYQERFFEIETDLARAEFERQKALLDPAQCPKVCPEVAQADQDCDELCGAATRYAELERKKQAIAEELRGPKADEIKKLEAELVAAKDVEFDVTQTWTFTKAEWAEQDYYQRLARHAHLTNPDDPALKAAFEEQLARFNELKERAEKEGQTVNEAMAKREEIEARIAQIKRDEELKAIDKELEAIRRPLDEAQRKYETALGRKKGGLFGPGTAIVQYNLPAIDKVDRCTSCHMGTTRGGFENVKEVEFKSHTFRRTLLGDHPPDFFGCTTCHDGQGRATTKFYAHAPGLDEDSHAFHIHYWEKPVLTGPPGGDGTEYMESKCRTCHQEEANLRAEVPCDTDAECAPLVTSPPDKKPNVTCGKPKAQGEAAAALQLATLPGTPEDQLPEPDASEEKMCVDRRGEPVLAVLAPHYVRGMKIVEEAGCYGCHPIKGFETLPKPAPDLTRVAHKMDPGYLISWIQNPKLHRPDTRMPKFWPELDQPDIYPYPVDPKELEQKRAHESKAMAAFLLDTSRKSTKYTYELEPIPAGLRGSAERGKELLGSLGCAGCHNLPDGYKTPERRNRGSHFDHGPNLWDLGAKTSKEWVYSWLRDPRRYAPDTRMPSLRLTPQEALDLATYLTSLRGQKEFAKVADAELSDPKLIDEGKKLVKQYGCYGCHKVEGYEEDPGIGADLSAFGLKLPERLDFGDYITDHHQQTWNAWTINKLRHPRVYAYNAQSPVVLYMPEFGLTEDEIRDVMTFLKSLRGDDDPEGRVLARELTGAEKLREQGRRLVRVYNCYGCHDIDGYEGELASLPELSGSNSIMGPPPLTNQGLKTQPDWLFRFIKRPFRMRPLPQVRMPTFGFTDEEATALVAMFSAIDGVPYPFTYHGEVGPKGYADYTIGKALFDAAGCQKCHVVGELGDGPVPPEVKAPNLLMGRDRLRARWLSLWLADPGSLQKDTAMPAFWLAGNQMQQFMATSAEFRAAVSGIDQRILETYAASPQLQIEAVRNFLFRMNEPPPRASAPEGSTAALEPTE